MATTTAYLATIDLHKAQQVFKWAVYSVLLINFGFYIYEDVDRALHVLHSGSSLFDISGEFAVTIDTIGWLALLFMFELETYALNDDQLSRGVERLIHGVRYLSYIMLAHTIVAYADDLVDLSPTVPVDDVSELCELNGQEVSFVYNLDYTEIDVDSCVALPSSSSYFWVGELDEKIVSTEAGLELERDLAWSDLIEGTVWLLIVFAIEIVVRLQNRGITEGVLMRTTRLTKALGYFVLLLLSIYWAALEHWLYTWDTFVWVAGFAAIEMNVSEWRDEILEEHVNDAAS